MTEYKLFNTIAKDICHSERFVVGKKWGGVPISHDILKNEYWIYNKQTEGVQEIQGTKCRFFLLSNLPDVEEEKTLEWKTVDLLNNIPQYSNRYSFETTLGDLMAALIRKQLNLQTLVSMARKFGNSSTQRIVETVRLNCF
jgi:hypothetical protein